MMHVNQGISSNFSRVVLVALSISIIVGCSSSQVEQVSQERFIVVRPVVKDTLYIKEYVADIHSIQNTELRARAGGYLETIHVDEGQFVKANELLFSISSKKYEQELLKAEASLASIVAETKAAEVEMKNARALVEKNIVSQSELDLVQARVEALKAKTEEAKANVASATLEISFAKVRAPFSGYINRIPNKVGSLIDEGTLLTSISNNNEMYVYFNVSENEYLAYATSDNKEKQKEVTLLLANGDTYAQKGVIETTESEIDKSTGNIAFRARFPNPDNLLKHGSSGKVLVSTELKNAMLVPQKSTFEIQENIYVFVIDEHNKISMRKITPSVRLQHFYVISEGLAPQDEFILEGIQRVKQGDTIDPEKRSLSMADFNK